MQTFLSESTFEESAAALDSKRLNKQLLEGRQMLNALSGNQKGFVNHPATAMWRGYEGSFLHYLAAVSAEMNKRGIQTEKNWQAIIDLFDGHGGTLDASNLFPHWWYSDPVSKDRIMWTHRANLYAKDNDYYAAYHVDYLTYQDRLASLPETVVCCASRRRLPGMKGLQPCGYYWPTHLED